MRITKLQGALFVSLPMMAIYLNYLHKLIAESSQYDIAMPMLCAGIFFFYFRDLKDGEELRFLGNNTGRYWKGWCFDPTIAPFLQETGICFPWGFRRTIRPEDYFDRRSDNMHHFDQRGMSYRMNVPGTMMQATLSMIIGIFIGKMNPFPGDPHYLQKRIGTRLIILAVLIGWTTGPGPSYFLQKMVNKLPSIGTGPPAPTVNVSVQFKDESKASPLFPAEHLFEPTFRNTNTWDYEVVDGKKYYKYNIIDEKIPVFVVTEPLCMAIPADRLIRFISNLQPTYAGNMDGKVEYYRKPSSVFFVVKFLTMAVRLEKLHSKSFFRNRPWGTLHTDWDEVEISEGFVAQALSKNKIADGALGGLVCF